MNKKEEDDRLILHMTKDEVEKIAREMYTEAEIDNLKAYPKAAASELNLSGSLGAALMIKSLLSTAADRNQQCGAARFILGHYAQIFRTTKMHILAILARHYIQATRAERTN